ncbi:50S ribosomal protein L17 [candidate division KSB1 bacterium]|nr:50S ribosomal protein L17 [candidate division KSB1 bacterium]
MRHRKTVPKLGRTASHRRALLANMASSLIIYKKIKTTTAKAKALRSYIERIITKARKGDLHSRRIVLKYLKNKDVVKELFEEVAPKYVETPGGYTRVTKIGRRRTDAAEMALIELIGFESIYKKKKEADKEEKRKRKEQKEKEDQKLAETAPPVKEETKSEEKSNS